MADRKDPFRGYNFKLEIAGVIRAGFHEAAGLDGDLGAAEESQTANSPQKIPGGHKVGDVTLKRGVIGDLTLWTWYKSIAQGKTEHKNGSIVLTHENGEEKARWNFVNGWPSKWTGPEFDASKNEVAIETLESAHEGLTKA